MKTVVITGAGGFLGWHLACAIRAEREWDVISVDRASMSRPEELRAILTSADAVLHCAGVNRGEPVEVEQGNVDIARLLTAALDASGARPHVLFMNSIHAGAASPYGMGKAAAGAVLGAWAARTGAPFADVLLPNLFGEHGRPGYNSFVATFAQAIANGREPASVVDRPVEILHAQAAADVLIRSVDRVETGPIRPIGHDTSVGAVLNKLQGLHESYVGGILPNLADPLDLELFNTLRSYLFPSAFPLPLVEHVDARGSLVEIARSDGGGQTFLSTSKPGVVRGDHFHRRKVERFVVVRGTAVIRIRRLGCEDVVDFKVTGAAPCCVDMPTLHTHSIENCGGEELLTLFWANEIFDPSAPDTYAERVVA